MIKIRALNEALEEDDENSNNLQVAKEAEETIAVSEYMRALTLRKDGNNEGALTLLTELLETNVLNEVSEKDKNDRLFSVKYNCHRNIALIKEEIGEDEIALEHYIQAAKLDDTDVYTLHRMGQLALRMKRLPIAEYSFERCLQRNPNHWLSADGLLQVHCLNENIIEAYGWALKWYKKDDNYERAIDVLTEIHEKFSGLIPLFEDFWNDSFSPPLGKRIKSVESVFPKHEIVEKIEHMIKPDLHEFKVDELTWCSVGKFITNVYKYLEDTKQSIIFMLSFEDIVRQDEKMVEMDVEEDSSSKSNLEQLTDITDILQNGNESNPKQETVTENNDVVFVAPASDVTGAQTPQQQSDSNAEDSDTSKIESESAKPKPRRRCSDLSFLEQWGWHKNRRYSRKKSTQDRVEVDTTLNGFLKRVFTKYFEENFDNESPFLKSERKQSTDAQQNGTTKENGNAKIVGENPANLQKITSEEFNNFIEEIKSSNVDLILLIFLWLKNISKFWEKPLSEDLKRYYCEIYEYYLNHYDLCTWNQLTDEEFNASYRMGVLYLELKFEQIFHSNQIEKLKSVDSCWKMLYHHLMFNSGCAFVIADELYDKNMIRLIWIDYCASKYESDLNKCVECLLKLEGFITTRHSEAFKLELPNLKIDKYVDLESVKSTRIYLQRKISLNNVKNLYLQNKFEDLVEILKDSLINSIEVKNCDNTTMKIQTQLEVLLESMWSSEQYKDCMIWAERSLKYATEMFVTAHSDTCRYTEWAETINFILIYIEELILLENYDIFSCLDRYLSRLVQSLAKILTHQLDSPYDKNNNPLHPVNTKRPWIILQQILQRTEDHKPVVIKTRSLENPGEVEDVEELIPHTMLILFTAHEFLGRRQWCTKDNGQLLLYTLNIVTPKFRAPFMDAYRDYIAEYLEQITYCLYGYPQRKARSRHIEDHDACPIELTWERAIQLFDIYRPENLPEFNSYKLESISADMEQLLLKILPLIPKEVDPSSLTSNIRNFINGTNDDLPQACSLLPHRISCIYYLLADYYFKSRDFSKTIKFYVLDLTCEPTRFDSWAGLALSKASKLETKLNSCTTLDPDEFLRQCENAIRCFEQCIKLNREHVLLWIEYGSFAYTIHSFCSRTLKQFSDTLSMEKFAYLEARKEQHLSTSFDCFSRVDQEIKKHAGETVPDDTDSHDEKWLHHYMLGKISEKRKEHPKVFLNHYLQAANFLYESNATYPIKINHNNPANLSIEALEVFYRTSSAIIKYLEQHTEIPRDIGRLITQTLKDLSTSPFAYNQAKIDDSSINALKRKLAEKAENSANKQVKLDIIQCNQPFKFPSEDRTKSENNSIPEQKTVKQEPNVNADEKQNKSRSQTPNNCSSKVGSPSRRGSQESTVTTTTTTGTGTTSSTSSSSGSDSSSSDSSSSDSDSGSSSDDETEKPDENSPLTESELEPIYKSCVRNLEECVTRFSEHYKSVYRLVNHYLRGPDKLKDIEKCRQLLLGTYKTSLGNTIDGLFSDRKNNNFFNGIWRIPSSEIDRPGNFPSHLVKCVIILLEVLKKSGDHRVLIDMALQLHRTPDNDKRYIKEIERKELCQQAVTYCIATMRDSLRKLTEKRNDTELLNLLIDVYKAHKKCIKHMNQKEGIFVTIIIDAYKLYVQDKVAKLPENANVYDLAMKLCVQELSHRKNQEKQSLLNNQSSSTPLPTSDVSSNPYVAGMSSSVTITPAPSGVTIPVASKPTPAATLPAASVSEVSKPVHIPGLSSRPRGRPVGSKNSTSTMNTNANLANTMPPFSSAGMNALMGMYGSPMLNESTYVNLLAEYYKLMKNPNLASSLLPQVPVVPTSSSPKSFASPTPPPKIPTPIPSSNTSSGQAPKVPQFDIKNLIASAASQVAKSTSVTQSSATISVGSGQLTITPTTSKSSISSTKEVKSNIQSQGFPNLPKSLSSVSVTKVPTGSPGISMRPIMEQKPPKSVTPQLQGLPDLPKSLTITPAPSVSFEKASKLQEQLPQLSVIPEKLKGLPKETDTYATKIKGQRKGKTTAPYSRGQPSSFPRMSQDIPTFPNYNLQNYNQQANLLKVYADVLQSTIMSQLQVPFQPPTKKPTTAKKGRQPKVDTRFPMPAPTMRLQEGMPNIPQVIQPTRTKAQSPFVPPFLPMSTSPVLAHSPNPSPVLPSISGLSRKTATPPASSLLQGNSPTKTLQQKLAEKQKANAMLIESTSTRHTDHSSGSSSSKKKGPDVIVLD